jgi:hypothetical protein
MHSHVKSSSWSSTSFPAALPGYHDPDACRYSNTMWDSALATVLHWVLDALADPMTGVY